MKYPVASAKNASAKPKLLGAAIVPIRTSMRDKEIRNTLFMVTFYYGYKFNVARVWKIFDSNRFITQFCVKKYYRNLPAKVRGKPRKSYRGNRMDSFGSISYFILPVTRYSKTCFPWLKRRSRMDNPLVNPSFSENTCGYGSEFFCLL
jgi:hypothetical protein